MTTQSSEKANINKPEQSKDYLDRFSIMLRESKNLIFRGAPGTGKSYLAKEIAAYIISNGAHSDYSKLDLEQKKQVEFVQFHPSYDYSDFVEGLRPKVNDDGTMGFELQDGIFKRFVELARKGIVNESDVQDKVVNLPIQEVMQEFFKDAIQNQLQFNTIRTKNNFVITGVDESNVDIFIPENPERKEIFLKLEEIRKILESPNQFNKVRDITEFFGKKHATHEYSYYFVICNEIRKRKDIVSRITAKQEVEKEYIFIIDEINRGEISKIFGELFYAIDPGYRGKTGEISTQYSNLHSNPDEKFYVPENVYIIGTMNDIDRSVDNFDFAMRRRFRFVEIRANDRLEMLSSLEDENKITEVKDRMRALNNAIVQTEDLNENYQIGASYFLKLNTMDFNQLWTDYLQPLLQEYIQGMYDEKGIMKRFADAYGYQHLDQDDSHETDQN